MQRTSTPATPVIPELNWVVPQNVNGRPSLAQPHQPVPHPPPVRATPDRFMTPVGHFSNPIDNLLAAATNFDAHPIAGSTPMEREALHAIELLKTTVAQHANYSYS